VVTERERRDVERRREGKRGGEEKRLRECF
jgi:hypothetical protein